MLGRKCLGKFTGIIVSTHCFVFHLFLVNSNIRALSISLIEFSSFSRLMVLEVNGRVFPKVEPLSNAYNKLTDTTNASLKIIFVLFDGTVQHHF